MVKHYMSKNTSNTLVLGSTRQRDIKVRKVLAWNAIHSMHVIWKSKINLPLKRTLFVATVESVLTYISESWTLTVQQQK